MSLVSIDRKLVTISQLIDPLTHLHDLVFTESNTPNVLLGDFNTDLMQANSEQMALKNIL